MPCCAMLCCAHAFQVVDKYEPEAAINSWPAKDTSTEFGLQYGLKDDLAPPDLSLHLVEELRKKGLSLKVGAAPWARLPTAADSCLLAAQCSLHWTDTVMCRLARQRAACAALAPLVFHSSASIQVRTALFALSCSPTT